MSLRDESMSKAKKELRKHIRDLQVQYTDEELNARGQLVLNRLVEHSALINASTILSYWPMPKEVNTTLINKELKKSKRVLLPVIDGNDLILKEFTSEKAFDTSNKYGICEPIGPTFKDYESIDAVIVPGVAFTTNGHRCGYGKGYYDRLLPKMDQARTIGVCFDFQLLETVPTDSHDVLLDEVIAFQVKNSAETLSGWGRYPKVPTTTSRDITVLTGNLPRITRGNGRSYGDQAICENGITWLNDRHNRIISFDETSGILRAESGILLSEILSTFIPRGWTLPVCPGTQYVSLGGALANDVHGKNHHIHGSFANHVRSFDILIPSGELLHCTRKQHPEIFWASIGGAGLLGHIESIEIVLKKIETSFFNTFSFKASNLNEMMELLDVQSIEHPYSVGWIDTSNKTMNGVLSCGTPLEKSGGDDIEGQFGPPALTLPDAVPNNMLNTFSIKLVNAYIGHRLATTKGRTPMKDFFFPLDGIGLWNRAYGNNGFMQFQCVVPIEQGKRNMALLMDIVKKSGCMPFMNVIKRMGAGNNGFLSFPTEGYTLALDFATSKSSIALIKYLNHWVATVGGRVYLGKDALLNAQQMRQMYPKVEEFLKVKRSIDPQNLIKSAQSLRLRLF